MLTRTEFARTLTYHRIEAEFCVAAEQDGSKLAQNAVIIGTKHSVPDRHNCHQICLKHIFTPFQTCEGKPT